MRRDPRMLLADIERAGADIASCVEAMPLDAHLGNGRTQAAVERSSKSSAKR